MKKILFTLITLTAAVYAQDFVKVTGDRVSLRAAPDTNAVLLDRAMLGDELTLKDNSNPDWVGVLPPASIDLWVNSEFVSNNVVLPKLLNIRSGPSLSHHTVGMANQGDVLTVRGEAGGWTKIAPTSNSVVWISRSYVEAPKPVVVVEPKPAEAAVLVQETQTVVQVVAEPTVQDVMTAASVTAEKKLTADPAKEQGVEGTYSGILQPAEGLLYKLVDNTFTDVIVCYVRGNAEQMKTFSDMKLEITGKAYWAESKDMPVVVPSKIKLPAVK
ncbi:MAG: SH3 domain-containing protein [Kiritimatiellales bacterium]